MKRNIATLLTAAFLMSGVSASAAVDVNDEQELRIGLDRMDETIYNPFNDIPQVQKLDAVYKIVS